MSEPGELVDLEALVVSHCLDDAAITTIAGDDVRTELPPGWVPPALQITRQPGTMVDAHTSRLERGVIQVQAWGETKEQAFDLANAAAVALKALADVSHYYGVVTEAYWQQTPWWNPDDEADTPRYTGLLVVFAHPSAAGS